MVTAQRELIAKAGLDPEIFARVLDPEKLTVGFARRVAGYKRHNLLVHDLAALVAAISTKKPLQFVFAGKAHPMDGDPGGGKDILRNLLRAGEELNRKHADKVTFVFLPDYDVEMARVMIPGVDLWLNNPVWGKEASGTSTMDAAVNGTLLLSTPDGCIPEMLQKGEIGLVFGRARHAGHDGNYPQDAYALYTGLSAAADAYYYGYQYGDFAAGRPTIWTDKMFDLVSFVAPYFLTPRLVEEYAANLWSDCCPQ